ncbi:MAG: capsule assembly Wzi family protein [Treponema sp.]|jgi:hypothetical protein|nr:capsule assembly Wzi family protein [Treponema sp.]
MNKNVFSLIIFFILTPVLFAVPFNMILTGDPVLEDIRFLSLESNIPFLSFSPPLAPGEIKNFLNDINQEELSQAGKEAYYRLLKSLVPQSRILFSEENFSLLFDINSTLETRANFNSKISYPRYTHIPPLVSLPLRLYFAEKIQLYIEPIFAINSRFYNEDNFSFNIPFGYNQISHNMSLRAFAVATGNWWNFQIGRDRLYWGTGHTGSLTFSDNSPFYDFARLSFFSSNVKYSFIVNQLPLTLTDNLFDPQRNAFPDDWKNSDNLQHTMQRYFYLHRLDFRLFKKVSIGLMEGIMAGNSPFSIRYFNPMVIYHDLFAWNDYPKWEPNNGDMIGSYLSLEVNWSIFKNLACYGQFVMNELTFPGENDENPNALGWMAGVQYAHSLNGWGAVFFLEFIYTDPYLSILSSPFASFIQMDRLENYYFLGYPRDTIAVTFGGCFFNNDKLNFNGRFSWIASGEHNKNDKANGMLWNWDTGRLIMKERTPTGTVENKLVLSLGSGWKPHSWLGIKANITGIYSINNNHVKGNVLGGQASISASFHL